MKRVIAAAAAALLLLCGCSVGPREGADILVSEDITPELPVVTAEEPAEESEPATVTGEEVTLPVEDTVAPPFEPEETEPAEPADEPSIPAQTEAPEEPEPEPPEFDFDDYDILYFDSAETLYSTISLNVREGPSVDYKSIGAIAKEQAVDAVGFVDETGWYLIEYRDGYGFVSGYYMTDEDPNPPENPSTDLPEMSGTLFTPSEPSEEDLKAKIISDFAAKEGVSPDSVVLAKYYGSFDAGEVVFLYSTELGYTQDMKYFSVAGYDFELSSGGYSIDLHTSDGSFVSISIAYDAGLLTDSDIAEIYAQSGGAGNRGSTEEQRR